MKSANGQAMQVAVPPYGRMVEEWENLIEGEGSAPAAWHTSTRWLAWREDLITAMNRVLWPRYDHKTHAWVGAARDMMLDLTRIDFELMRELRPLIKAQVQLKGEAPTHYELFQLEDIDEDLNDKVTGFRLDRTMRASLRRYLAGNLDKRRTDDIVGGFNLGLGSKAGNTDLEFKRFFQRPRPYQMAVLMDERWFTHQHAKSAVTPAMISGHCFETAMAGITAFYRAREIGCGADALDAIVRHAIDVGDRRVIAGVHYPSDNISSWITAMAIAEHVCFDRDGATWLWKGLQRHSIVFEAIRSKLAADSSCAYAKSWAFLHELAPGGSKSTADVIRQTIGTGATS